MLLTLTRRCRTMYCGVIIHASCLPPLHCCACVPCRFEGYFPPPRRDGTVFHSTVRHPEKKLSRRCGRGAHLISSHLIVSHLTSCQETPCYRGGQLVRTEFGDNAKGFPSLASIPTETCIASFNIRQVLSTRKCQGLLWLGLLVSCIAKLARRRPLSGVCCGLSPQSVCSLIFRVIRTGGILQHHRD